LLIACYLTKKCLFVDTSLSSYSALKKMCIPFATFTSYLSGVCFACRSPIFLGSKDEVDRIEQLSKEEGLAA